MPTLVRSLAFSGTELQIDGRINHCVLLPSLCSQLGKDFSEVSSQGQVFRSVCSISHRSLCSLGSLKCCSLLPLPSSFNWVTLLTLAVKRTSFKCTREFLHQLFIASPSSCLRLTIYMPPLSSEAAFPWTASLTSTIYKGCIK